MKHFVKDYKITETYSQLISGIGWIVLAIGIAFPLVIDPYFWRYSTPTIMKIGYFLLFFLGEK